MPQQLLVTVVAVKVKPNSRVSLLAQAEGGAWLAQLKSPPIDGKANEELLALVARHFGCRKSAVSLKSGASARTKLVRIEGPISLPPGCVPNPSLPCKP
jgi:uncharacterized protein